MSNVLNQIAEWSKTLRFWERLILDKLISSNSLDETDYEEILHFTLQEAGLTHEMRPLPELTNLSLDSTSSNVDSKIHVKSISNFQNVNALVDGQKLEFGDALTAIFGGNGSGKSGYSRVLASAAFSRGDREVLPNVLASNSNDEALRAEIEIRDMATGDEKKIPYSVGTRVPELKSVYVFDTTSVRVHLTGSNNFSFSPAGLAYLTGFAEATDRIKSRIEEICLPGRLQYSAGFKDWFEGESVVTNALLSLDVDGDLTTLRKLSALTEAERIDFTKMEVQLAALRLKDVSAEREKISKQVQDIRELRARLDDISALVGDTLLNNVADCISDHNSAGRAVNELSLSSLGAADFQHTGANLWHQFISAAKEYSKTEGTKEFPYPQESSRCLLCHQPLSPEAYELITKTWSFLESDAKSRLQKSSEKIEKYLESLNELDLGFFTDQYIPFRILQENNASLFQRIVEYLDRCSAVRLAVCRDLDEQSISTVLPSIPLPITSDLDNFIDGLEKKSELLLTEDISEELRVLEEKVRGYRHRIHLGEKLQEIEDRVAERVWARKASKIRCSTTHITRKYNEIFTDLVSNRYIEIFQDIIGQLNRPLSVRVNTHAKKGQTYKRIVVEAHPDMGASDLIDKVLSEGEKRAVAIADFLTEVRLDDNSSAIILDDPVTSLDLEWRELISRILVAESASRQVIVFTHDLPFLYFLRANAEEAGCELQTHWVKRGDIDNKPGYVFCGNSPAMERDYRSSKFARDLLSKAKDAEPQEQERILREGFGALRTCYEAFIIFDLFNEVVMRFNERVSVGRLKDIVWNEPIALTTIAKTEMLSRYIEGHLHSDNFLPLKPTTEKLHEEICAFDKLKSELKELKKAKA